jgi:hypothetical protein
MRRGQGLNKLLRWFFGKWSSLFFVRLRHIGLNPGRGRHENSNQFAAASLHLQHSRACQFSCQIGGGYFFTSARILA